ncbi:MAG TPA: hypothetical protein ENI68_07980 [Gammaproteobacteria bacterium]|nr:hypothetical protein [Gammaproteobacteria bacterium]
MLKDAIKCISLAFAPELTAISTGASSGLFLIKEAVTDIDGLQKQITTRLCNHPDFRLLTFILETCSAGSLLEAKERLLAQLRFRQLRSITMVPEVVNGNSGKPSEWDGIRPTSETPDHVTYNGTDTVEKEKVAIAPSEFARWNYGRVKKQDYYLEEVSELNLPEEDAERYAEVRTALEEKKYGFTRDLNEIASSPKLDSDNPVYPRLDGKIAIFYADGNDFGAIQRDAIQSPPPDQQVNKQQEFDKTIRTNRAQLLADLLDEMLKGNNGLFPHMITRSRDNAGKEIDALRFETLLWGGDELLFVMPAWIGFEFVQLFFRKTEKWQVGGKPLTHSAGLLLCSAKTPIRIARELAQMIADHIKEETRKTEKGKRDAWDYMVLESIDYPTHRDYSRFLRERYGTITEYRPLTIPPAAEWEHNRDGLIHVLGVSILLMTCRQAPVRFSSCLTWVSKLVAGSVRL